MPSETTLPSNGTGAATEITQPVIAQDGIDYLAAITALEDENKRLSTERESYRQAYIKGNARLKAKDLPPEERADIDDERFQRIVDERLASSQLVANQQKMADLVKKMARENQELKLSSQNKPSNTSSALSSAGAATPTATTAVNPTVDQIAKARGWSPKMIERYKKNLAEQKDIGFKLNLN